MGPDGNIYATDYYSIRRITPQGVVSTVAGGAWGTADGPVATAGLGGLRGLDVTSSGAIYFVEAGRVRLLSGGVVSTLAGRWDFTGLVDGTGTDARFSAAYGIAVDTAGNAYVTEVNAGWVRKVTPAGVVTTVASGLQGPRLVTLDAAGGLLIAETNRGRLVRWTSATGFVDVSGAVLMNPYGVAVAPDGSLRATAGYQVRAVTAAKVVSTVAGTASAGYADTSVTTGAAVQVSSGAATSFTDTGLAAGTEYLYTVRATNSAGDGPRSAVLTLRP
jgi:hypothetical protein